MKTPLDIFLNETTGRPQSQPAPSPLAVKPLVPAAGNEISPRVFTQALDLAETIGKEFSIPGNIIAVPWATDSTVVVGLVYHDVARHPAIQIGKNFFLGGIPCNRFYLTWTAQAGKSIQFMVLDDPAPQTVRVQ